LKIDKFLSNDSSSDIIINDGDESDEGIVLPNGNIASYTGS